MPEFRIQHCLGRGGFGEVYKAVMSRGNGVEMDVAVKVLRSDLDPSSQGIQRLRDEGRLLGRMTHPSILRVYDLVVIEGHAALVSEYVAGDDLSRIFKEEEVPKRPAFEIVAQIAAALDAAWSHPSVADGKPLHLVHRDIKPDNVRIDPFGAVKLLDFGIAQASRVRREAHTSVNTIMGSTQYLSPERLVQQEVGPEADVFALGCTAFEVLAGEPLFVRKSMRQMYLLMVDQGRFDAFVNDRCASHFSRLGDEGVLLVRDCTAFDKTLRPTAGAIALRCDNVADNMTGPTLRSWCRTRRWSAPPEMTGPLEGQTFVVQTGSGVGPLPPTATSRHRLPTAAELAAEASPTPEPAPTQSFATSLVGGASPPTEEPTVSNLAAVAPAVDALAPSPVSGPSPWTPEERLALVSGRIPESSMELPPDRSSNTVEGVLPRSLELDEESSTPANSSQTSLGLPPPEAVPDDLAEPIGTSRLPVLERQRSPELWPLPMVQQPTPSGAEETVTPTGLESAEVTVRLRRVPRKRADGSVAPRRRLTKSASGETVREVTREIPLVEALPEPTVRVLVPPREEPTQQGPDETWPGLDDDRTVSDPRPVDPRPVDLALPLPTGTDEVAPRSVPADELLEVGEATTGSLHLGSGLHAAKVSEVAPELPTMPPRDASEEAATQPEARVPYAQHSADGRSRSGGFARPAFAAPLLASAGGLAGLVVGVVVLLVILLVVWLAT